jgi:hypothetical protein
MRSASKLRLQPGLEATGIVLIENGIMRKRIVGRHDAQQGGQSDKGWLDLKQIATVEVTSEDPSFPIEYAFGSNDGPGWRASEGGEQQIRIIFDNCVDTSYRASFP